MVSGVKKEDKESAVALLRVIRNKVSILSNILSSVIALLRHTYIVSFFIVNSSFINNTVCATFVVKRTFCFSCKLYFLVVSFVVYRLQFF